MSCLIPLRLKKEQFSYRRFFTNLHASSALETFFTSSSSRRFQVDTLYNSLWNLLRMHRVKKRSLLIITFPLYILCDLVVNLLYSSAYTRSNIYTGTERKHVRCLLLSSCRVIKFSRIFRIPSVRKTNLNNDVSTMFFHHKSISVGASTSILRDQRSSRYTASERHTIYMRVLFAQERIIGTGTPMVALKIAISRSR